MSRAGNAAGTNSEQQKPLAIARDVAAVAGIFLFFAGFVYQFFLEQGLGLHRTGNAPIYEIVADSWAVFQRHPAPFTLTALAFLVIVLAHSVFRWRVSGQAGKAYDFAELVIVATATVGAFIYIFSTARATGREVANRTRSGVESSSVEIAFSSAVQNRYPGLVDASKNHELRIVGRDSQFMYILDQPIPELTPVPSARTFAIRVKDVESYFVIIP
jgi:hypothetical protein